MRASGILLPIFSLPGNYGIGCFSEEAYRFVDFLVEAGQKYWQILPLGPTSVGDSPYQSFSVFAGNPYFISLERLIEKGVIAKKTCDRTDFGTEEDSIDYGQLYRKRFRILKKAYENTLQSVDHDFQEYLAKESYWLPDYAFFMALKGQHRGMRFDTWEDELRFRDEKTLAAVEESLTDEIAFYEYLQYEFYLQWKDLKAYANERGIKIIGDIPIYVSADSADVWAHPELFQMGQGGQFENIAGCPPDGFSETGQIWGNPLYKWDYHEDTDFQWWVRRMEHCAELYDVIRIDHFRGFDEYYAIPAGEKDATNGHWEEGPGRILFDAIEEKLPDIKIIAEDLGYMTETVKELIQDTGFPNMKVLEFAFDSRDSSGKDLYLPYNYDKNCVVYTGTHDNETLLGWLEDILPEEKEAVKAYLDVDTDDNAILSKKLIRLAQSSTADLCVIPIQDYLGLGKESRINTPSTLGSNWRWRVSKELLTPDLAKEIRKLTETYGRI